MAQKVCVSFDGNNSTWMAGQGVTQLKYGEGICRAVEFTLSCNGLEASVCLYAM
jgi:hypothetical protein